MKSGLIVLFVASSAVLSGCSVFSKGQVNANEVLRDFGGGGSNDYRENQDAMVTPLEIPPALSVPDDLSPRLARVNGAMVLTPKAIAQVDLAKAQGVEVVQNDCARYAKITMPLEQLWPQLTQFFTTLELPVEKSDAPAGLMISEFTERKNLVPKDAQPFLTELFNRASPKKAEGYYDKYTFRLERDGASSELRLYVTHEAMMELDSGTDWKQMPSEPDRAALMLNQFVKFLALVQQAAAQNSQASGQ